jgi:hypothetical protein
MPSYKEVLELEYDKKQMQFAIDGTLIINQKIINEQTPINVLINNSNIWICPFCLEESNKFSIESHGLIKCPNCKVEMKIKTLLFVKECSNIDYARWVFEYRLSGFFSKINFEKWNKKMKDLGISYEFWNEYKKLRGDNLEVEKENNIDLKDYIDLLVLQIGSGITKDEIIKESYSYNFNDSQFHYAYKEAEAKIKSEVK